MKRSIWIFLGAVLLLAGSLAPASAGTILNPIFTPTLGVQSGDVSIDPEIDSAGIYTVGRKFKHHENFVDTVSFKVSSPTTIALKILSFGSINWSTAISGPGTGTINLLSGGTGTIRGKTGFVVTGLITLSAPGSWLFALSGTACSCAGYVISLANAAVTPIPAAMLMLLTSLGGLGGFAWRRRKSAAA